MNSEESKECKGWKRIKIIARNFVSPQNYNKKWSNCLMEFLAKNLPCSRVCQNIWIICLIRNALKSTLWKLSLEVDIWIILFDQGCTKIYSWKLSIEVNIWINLFDQGWLKFTLGNCPLECLHDGHPFLPARGMYVIHDVDPVWLQSKFRCT